MVRSSAAAEYGILIMKEIIKNDQNGLLNKSDDNTVKIKWIALSGSFTLVKSLESRFKH